MDTNIVIYLQWEKFYKNLLMKYFLKGYTKLYERSMGYDSASGFPTNCFPILTKS